MIAAGADEAELLAGDREDEVGLLLGDELAVGLGALEEPLAGQTAGADRDPGLVDVVAAPRGSSVRVGERREPVDLVRRRARRACTRHDRADDAEQRAARRASGPARRPRASTPRTMKTMTIVVPRSGCSMISADRHGGQRAAPARTSTSRAAGPRRRAARPAASPARRQRDLRELRRLHRKPPPSTIHECAPLIVAPSGEQHRDQAEARRDVDERRVRAQQRGSRRPRRPRRAPAPIAMLSRCRLRYAFGSSPASTSRGRVADQTSSEPSSDSAQRRAGDQPSRACHQALSRSRARRDQTPGPAAPAAERRRSAPAHGARPPPQGGRTPRARRPGVRGAGAGVRRDGAAASAGPCRAGRRAGARPAATAPSAATRSAARPGSAASCRSSP